MIKKIIKHSKNLPLHLLETELKDSVFGKKDGEYGLSYNDLIAPMIKAIQELKAEVDLLKKECKCK